MLKFKQPDPVPVEVEGQTLYVHALTAGQFAELLGAIETYKKAGTPHKADFLLLHLSVRDAQGQGVFASAEEAMGVPITVASALLPVCLKVNGMGQHEEKKAASGTTQPD